MAQLWVALTVLSWTAKVGESLVNDSVCQSIQGSHSTAPAMLSGSQVGVPSTKR